MSVTVMKWQWFVSFIASSTLWNTISAVKQAVAHNDIRILNPANYGAEPPLIKSLTRKQKLFAMPLKPIPQLFAILHSPTMPFNSPRMKLFAMPLNSMPLKSSSRNWPEHKHRPARSLMDT